MHTAHVSPARNRSSALQHFEFGNMVEIRNGIRFDFYSGLPHMLHCFHGNVLCENGVKKCGLANCFHE